MSSAQSAASAAFKGITQPNPKRPNKPSLRLLIDQSGSRASLAAAQTSQQRSQAKLTSQNKPARPARSPVGTIGIDRNTPRQKAKRGSTTSDEDTLLVLLSSSDYFSNYRGYNHSEVTLPAPYRLRTSINTNPQDMLEQVRQSINSKSKVGVAKEAARKLQAALDEFRHSVDQRRLQLQLRVDVSLGYEVPELSSAYVYKQPAANALHSSIGSVSDTEGPITPVIKLTVADPETEDPEKTSTPQNKSQNNDSFSYNGDIYMPVTLPSANAVVRGSVTTLDGLVPTQLLQNLLQGLVQNNSRTDLEEAVKLKVRRKPPPGMLADDEVSLSGHSSIAHVSDAERVDEKGEKGIEEAEQTDFGTEDQRKEKRALEETKLPVFPDIPKKQKKHTMLFRRRKHKEQSVRQEFSSDESETEEFVPSRSATPVVPLQQVKFKTTMRKVNKRREKKTAFNEDKPWKNHSELDYVSEQQRKRYEGLWVSNKGLYMHKVRTRLVGVKYESDEGVSDEKKKSVSEENGKSNPDEKKQMSEKEISQFAAKLSSKTATAVDSNEQDMQQLHSLVDADVQELIHGVVVKRIWSRSKLSQEVLAAIWDLVDFRKDGTLNKAEFIVGMWLVDQCLYGRKLPKEVGELVWASLGSIGVRVVIKKKRR